jgi:hypothetical protein
VGHDALELVPVELVEQAARDGDGGVLGVAARGEGVRGRVLDDKTFGIGRPPAMDISSTTLKRRGASSCVISFALDAASTILSPAK